MHTAAKTGFALALGIAASTLLGACSSTMESTQRPTEVAALDAYADGCVLGQADAQYPDYGQPVRRVPDSPATRSDWQRGYQICFGDTARAPRFVGGR